MFPVTRYITPVQLTWRHLHVGYIWMSIVFGCPVSHSLIRCLATNAKYSKIVLEIWIFAIYTKMSDQCFLITIWCLGRDENKSTSEMIWIHTCCNAYINAQNGEDHNNWGGKSHDCLDWSFFFATHGWEGLQCEEVLFWCCAGMGSTCHVDLWNFIQW